jgi:tRNA pseudouridine55 synthase
MGRKRRGLPLNGWLVIDKDGGMTSAQVVGRVRRLTNAAKAGHAGTLDPLATGILPIALGEATKTVAYVQDGAKTYRFTVRWGEERTTDDAEGEVTRTDPGRPSAAEIQALLPAFTGLIQQAPPAFSAIKLDGERAYDLARAGATVDLAPRPVRIDRFVLFGQIGPDEAEFEVDCGKGAYVRALARDLGRRLGCFGHVTALRRTRVGPYREAAAFSLAKLAELCDKPAPFEYLLPVETALDDIPALAVTGPQAERLHNGQPIMVLDAADGPALVKNAGRPVALAEVAGGEVRPVRVFNL